jgi:hypothetical protein
MQPATATENHGKFLARSCLTSQPELLDPDDPVYFFTASAARRFITADVLSGCELHPNQVYARTEQDLYVLEHFCRLKHVRGVLSADYFCGNRGLVVNERRIRRFKRITRSVGFHTANRKRQPAVEWTQLSRQGLREFKKRLLLKPRPPR